MNRHPLLLAAAAAALALAAAPVAAAGPAAQAQPIRVQPTVLPLRVDASVGDKAASVAKPAAPASLPGPVAVIYGRTNSAGQMETWCNIEHDHKSAHPVAGQRRERQR